ncbi:MAG: hypothetical protein Q8N51_00595 [Gammaproteobacteria bacterium]|nr:hypothetical protein [Gammaproteobacteria bacterium]
MTLTTTLNAIRKHGPCADGWQKLLTHLGKTQPDDEPVSLLTILDSNGLDDALWVLRCFPQHDREWRLYAVRRARQVQHLMTDPRSIAAIDVAERYANGEATTEELAAAGAAAWAAARAAEREAARVAARAAAGVAAGAAVWEAAREAQEAELRRVIAEIEGRP